MITVHMAQETCQGMPLAVNLTEVVNCGVLTKAPTHCRRLTSYVRELLNTISGFPILICHNCPPLTMPLNVDISSESQPKQFYRAQCQDKLLNRTRCDGRLGIVTRSERLGIPTNRPRHARQAKKFLGKTNIYASSLFPRRYST